MAEKSKTWKSFGNKLPSNEKECFYCGGRLWGGNRTTDHILPKSKGGILSNDNKVYSCIRCNQMKQDHTVEDFRGMVRFLLREMEKEFKEKTEYYRNVIDRLDLLLENKKDGKTKKSISSNQERG